MARTNDNAPASDFITVTFVKVGNSPVPVSIPADSTVADGLTEAFGGFDGIDKVRVNGTDYDLNAILDDGDRVVLTQTVKGGARVSK